MKVKPNDKIYRSKTFDFGCDPIIKKIIPWSSISSSVIAEWLMLFSFYIQYLIRNQADDTYELYNYEVCLVHRNVYRSDPHIIASLRNDGLLIESP